MSPFDFGVFHITDKFKERLLSGQHKDGAKVICDGFRIYPEGEFLKLDLIEKDGTALVTAKMGYLAQIRFDKGDTMTVANVCIEYPLNII